jgi:putative peptidoglycan lipid II flippase
MSDSQDEKAGGADEGGAGDIGDDLYADPAVPTDPDSTTDDEQVGIAPAQRELVANSALMAVGTVISRATGLLRDIMMTAALGLGIVADLFTLGNTIPNTVYVLTVGGAVNAIFVPQLVRHMKDDRDGGSAYADRLLTLVGTALILMTALALIFAAPLTKIYATNAYSQQEVSLAVAFARYCLPQVFFYGLFTMLSQVLNARDRFGPPMFAPIANNVVSIAVFASFIAVAGTAAVSGNSLTPQQTAWLGLGSTIAVAAQALILIPFVRAAGYHYRPRFDWRGVGLGKAGGLAIWTFGLLAANQIAFIVHSRLATQANVLATQQGVAAAGITTYQKAYLIFFLPHSIVTVSIVTALLPGLSRIAHRGDLAAVSRMVTDTIRTACALVIPIMAVLFPLAPLLAALMFGFGAASRDAAFQIGYTVDGMLVGLVPFTIYYVLLRGWYSMEDTKTPFFMSLWLNGIDVVLAILLFFVAPTALKVPAIGLAFGLTYWAMMVIAWPVLARRMGGMATRSTWTAIGRMLVAGVVTALASLATLLAFTNFTDGLWESRLEQLLVLIIASAVGFLAFLLAAKLLRISEVGAAVGVVRRKLAR